MFPPPPSPLVRISRPDLETYVGYVLAGFRSARPDCPLDSCPTPEGRRIVDPEEGALIAALQAHLGVPADGYDASVFICRQEFDVVSPKPSTDGLVDAARANGMDIHYRVDHDPAGHVGWTDGLPDAVAFATAAVAGQ
ncbi:hypothetical protein [Corynebacterium nuruki]|uniref:Alpha/beta hydrolase n=1 Tax=Corynebacterium nuruki TaxID=1032851 RepID=A0A3D4SWW1_9CORY|nr:hypothetical protein [Corynebacterium nuruki]HCT13756.1 hypothetical protein [Corynebacterium nuruki]